MNDTAHYQAPDWFTRTLFNPAVATLTRCGISVLGSRILQVRGRRTGEIRQVPVNLLEVDGDTYLVAPRGVTQWVRNVRAADGELTLVLGRRSTHWRAEELPDAVKPPVLRAYLRRWAWEVGRFFDGVDAGATDAELRTAGARHPVFRLHAVD